MTKYEYTGYVENVRRETWGAEIETREDASDQNAPFPCHNLFSISKKNLEKLPDDLGKDDRVKITFTPFYQTCKTKDGREFKVQKLMFMGMSVLEKAEKSASVNADLPDDDDPLPF